MVSLRLSIGAHVRPLICCSVMLLSEKVYLFSFLTHAACWVSNFGLKKFEKVEPISTPSESKKSKSNSGSNETMKNILALSIGHHCC